MTKRTILRENSFKRDQKLMRKRRYSEEKMTEIVVLLANDKPLPTRCRPHKLVGEYTGCWECHIKPDWLLIYQIEGEYLKLLRTGTHSDLFD